MMDLLDNERERISEALRATPIESPRFREMYVANTALAWASDPEMFSSPLDYIEGRANRERISTPVVKEGYPSLSHQASS
jgi:hypothetical protein